MKVSHSTYMDSNGSLGLMKAELEINTNIPFIPKLSLDYSILKKMNEVGVISMDIKRIEKLNILYKHNIELVNNFKKFEKILKKHFEYEYYDQNSFGLEFFVGKKEEMLQSLCEIKKENNEPENYNGVFSIQEGSAYFVFNGTLLTISPKETKNMFKEIEDYFEKNILEAEKEVQNDYQLYKKYEKIFSEEGLSKIKDYLIAMAECDFDLNVFVSNAEGLNNYIFELKNSVVYVN